MNVLLKHYTDDIKVNSRTRLQRIQDRKAMIKSIASTKEQRNELIMIAVFGGLLMILCIQLANNLLIMGVK